ncbi:MAG: tetratricopeptide repeat protein [Bacteroidetes bacterium]|nr:tetratricopeptide repeat protein [Bacteroidota bacterium]
MKRMLLSTAIVLTVVFAKSQTIEDAKKDLYYERYQSAKEILQTITQKNDQAPDAWYWLGEVYLKQHDVQMANEVLSDAMEKLTAQQISKKKNPLVFIGMAHALLDSGLKDKARSMMTEVLEESKYKDPDALIAAAKANIESKNGDLQWALELLGKAEKKSRKNAELYLEYGEAYRKLIDGANAIANYEKALKIDPSYAEPLYKEGLIYKTQNNTEVYLEKFTRAYAADSAYTPALYELYGYYFFRDPAKAGQFLQAYIRHSDPDPSHAYMITDLQYMAKNYRGVIDGAKQILTEEKTNALPRLYKLIAYSYAALKDSVTALNYMTTYFEKQDTAGYLAKDYELMAILEEQQGHDKGNAITWYKKALAANKNRDDRLSYMTTLAQLQQDLGNHEREAVWRGHIFKTKETPSNLDIYNWGVALYGAKEYELADSVFALYQDKYPDQIYGYLWRARVNALIDTSMEKGLAVPHYLKVIEIASKDTVKNRSLLLRAYQYLGAYEATITKNYVSSLNYYDKILALDPGDNSADKNAKLLTQWIAEGKGATN